MCVGASASTGSVRAWRRVPDRWFSNAAARRAGSDCRRRGVQRSNRLSRSRDFDVVYRHGRSVSTRFLTLYAFAREQGPEEPRLGLAVPKAVGSSVERNRIKRRLREVWRAKLDAAAVDTRRDYVIVVRPGLPEAAEARGHLWLAERVDEVLAKAAA